ncbi:FecR domain-containing protein [Pedobacter sp. MC2016-14]|uniref:FecR family protein n=1 Tax=Pedobacter sp. MC2016-14 TaxID=2897327 RepID=UPI001E5060CB|nr:FecR domain-containing protein [Pedobacter sp. MC2016-14]MCD0488976.1 FecR domain-containing protein [Pedobacter sp. MC2016-14]
MDQEKLQQLFQEYADKTCTAEEHAAFMAIVASQEAKAELDQLMEREWKQNPNTPMFSQHKASQLFDQIMSSAEQKGTDVKVRKLNSYSSWAVWAAASILLGLFVFFYYNSGSNIKQKQSVALQSKAVAKAKLNKVTADEHRKIKLPDGSTVVLNNNSTLEFPEDFVGGRREVILKGEGYFDIKHNPDKPFVVYAGKIKTTVLGTAFNINAYGDKQDVVVTVTRGKVMVQDESKTIGIIVPDQQIVYNKIQMKSLVMPVMAKKSIAWQERDLFFDEVTMEEAAGELSRYFNVKISFANEASKECRFTGTFLRGEGLEEILKVITSFNHTTYQKESGGFLISGNGCK